MVVTILFRTGTNIQVVNRQLLVNATGSDLISRMMKDLFVHTDDGSRGNSIFQTQLVVEIHHQPERMRIDSNGYVLEI